uniref:Uncharacterized protein n=1 Tax=Peronospora matthiolae TaxID=2874970 RepID=A0AAV1VPQ1_9STRA
MASLLLQREREEDIAAQIDEQFVVLKFCAALSGIRLLYAASLCSAQVITLRLGRLYVLTSYTVMVFSYTKQQLAEWARGHH